MLWINHQQAALLKGNGVDRGMASMPSMRKREYKGGLATLDGFGPNL